MPISESRGAIIYGLGAGLNSYLVLILSMGANIAAIPAIFLILQQAHFREFAFKIFRKRVEKHYHKNKKFELLEEMALFSFVAVPLPFTGVFSAAIISELLGWDWKKSFLALSAGVVVASLAVWAGTLGILKIFS
jgi:uncharacterized membrane protein